LAQLTFPPASTSIGTLTAATSLVVTTHHQSIVSLTIAAPDESRRGNGHEQRGRSFASRRHIIGAMIDTSKSLQEHYAPSARCFGCGPANARGLRIRSFPLADAADAHVVCDFTPELHHEAFENVHRSHAVYRER
jgi:hypothetical protein